ncbi:excalibur calcium-binding domain-containing protein [Synechocystis sp. PCC 7509]
MAIVAISRLKFRRNNFLLLFLETNLDRDADGIACESLL